MKAVMLAAGVGRRLFGDDNHDLPKALLRFDGKTLLARHIEILLNNAVEELVLIVGHRKEDLLAEANAVAPEGFIRSVFNPRFEEGPILSLWTASDELRSGEDILFMDADVLYHPEMMNRLIASPSENCFVMDRDIELVAEPVKLCIRDGEPVDFGKQVTDDYHQIGEWPGFLRMTADIAAKVAAATQVYIDDDNLDVIYEEAICDVLVSEPVGTFGFEDITGIPWIEIDFPSDLLRAEKIIYPQVAEYIADGSDADDFPVASKASGE